MSGPKVKLKKKPSHANIVLSEMARKFQDAPHVVVGLPTGSDAYPDSGVSVIEVGATHEFGEPGKKIPERSFLRTTVHEKRAEYKALIKTITKRVVAGQMSFKVGLGLLGLQAQTDVRAKITDISEPPLKVRIGGNPLVDTGHLRQSITYEVRK